MDITSLLQDAVRSFRSTEENGHNGVKGLAAAMRMQSASLSHKVSPTYPTAHLSPEEFIEVCKRTGDMAPFYAMAAALGCVVLPMTVPQAQDVSPTLATNFKEDGEWLQAASSAFAAPSVSDNMLAKATKEAFESIGATVNTIMQLQAKHDAGMPSKPTLQRVA